MFLFVFVEKHFDNFYANFYSPKRRGEIERVMVASFLGRFQLLHFNWVIFAQECLFHEAISHFHLCCCCCHHPRAAKFQRNCSNLHKSKMFALILLWCDHYQKCRWHQHLHPSLVLSLSRYGLLGCSLTYPTFAIQPFISFWPGSGLDLWGTLWLSIVLFYYSINTLNTKSVLTLA